MSLHEKSEDHQSYYNSSSENHECLIQSIKYLSSLVVKSTTLLNIDNSQLLLDGKAWNFVDLFSLQVKPD